jgi:hypothetical protein
MTSHTSMLAYADIVVDGTMSKQCGIILDLLRTFPDREFSRFDIHGVTGMRLASVCGRTVELLAYGLIVEAGTKVDPITLKTVKTLKLAPRQTNAAAAV